ncbi:flavodoxin [Acidaminococcus fermentans]
MDIVLFATSGGSSISKAYRDLRKAYPKLNITNGVLLNGSISGNLA